MNAKIKKREKLWHALSIEDIFLELESSKQGLSQEEAKRRLKILGLNKLRGKRKESVWRLIFKQFHNPLIYILFASAIVAFVFGKKVDGSVVLGVVFLNTLIGFIQEFQSNQAMQALLKQISHTAVVLRGGISQQIPAEQVVQGDVVVLQAGDKVPADLRLFSVKNLSCDESALTGESLPVDKKCEKLLEEIDVADRKNIAYNGTLVTSGQGVGIVIATGEQTEFGKISALLQEVKATQTPLEFALENLSKWITLGVAVTSIFLFLIGFLRGYGWVDAAIATISLAVAVIPEGLPAIITIAAAIGVQRMARKRVIVKHLLGVETLGSTTIICTDKTGTLTENHMHVESLWTAQGETDLEAAFEKKEAKELFIGAALCNDAELNAEQSHGDPTELALLLAARKCGFDEKAIRQKYTRIDMIPFESENRWMASLHKDEEGRVFVFLKGAPEIVLQRSSVQNQSENQFLSFVDKKSKEGMRLIAVACKEFPTTREFLEKEDVEEGFDLLGCLALMDPPRKEVQSSIKKCQEAGIAVKMITGDHPVTAKVIAKRVGFAEVSRVITGSELDLMPQKEKEEAIYQTNVFARVLPEHKLEIVRALQKKAEVVAMTGDGVNDSPSLKQADVGIAMGITGTAVAKEAADMVLTDDSFNSIEAAIEEGRRFYDNLIKSIVFIFPTNIAQGLVVIVALLFFPIQAGSLLMPILPVQILWVNLIVAVGLGLPLAFEAMEPDVMQRPPRRKKESVITPSVLRKTFFVAFLILIGTVGMFLWSYAENIHAGIQGVRKAQTMTVTTLVFFQIFYLFHCRSFRFSLRRMGFFSNPYLLIGVALILIIQVAFAQTSFMQKLFSTAALSWKGWILSIFVSSLINPIICIEKWMTRKGWFG